MAVDSDEGAVGSVGLEAWRARARALLARPWWERLIIALIIINAITLGMETSPSIMAAVGPWLLALDSAILAVFVVEIAIRLFAHGARFFRDPWSLFDLAVVAVALVPASGEASVLRALRIIRALRLISTVKSMRRVVAGLLAAIPGMGSIVMLLSLVFYVFSVMATKLFGASFPEWFGSIGASAYTLFQIMTLESWSMGIVRPVWEVFPWAPAFFIPFILVTSFTVLNLFIGIIVDAMNSQAKERDAAHDEAVADVHHADMALVLSELRALRAEVQGLKASS